MVSKNNKRIQVTVSKRLLDEYYFIRGEKISLSGIFNIALEDYLKDLKRSLQ